MARALGWSNTGVASTASDMLQAALAAGVLGNALLDGHRRGDVELGLVNVLLITEATSTAMLLDGAVKYAVGRARPAVWLSHSARDTRDGNLSFFSGHATFAFAVAASSIGYFRIAAEAHYLTDVLAGAGAGTLVGWAVPHFFHPARHAAVQLRPAPGGVALSW